MCRVKERQGETGASYHGFQVVPDMHAVDVSLRDLVWRLEVEHEPQRQHAVEQSHGRRVPCHPQPHEVPTQLPGGGGAWGSAPLAVGVAAPVSEEAMVGTRGEEGGVEMPGKSPLSQSQLLHL